MPPAPSTEAKSKEVQKLLRQIVEAQGVRVQHISAFGYKYDSAFWIAVDTDLERDRLKADQALLQKLHSVFEQAGYLKIIHDTWDKEINKPALEYLKHPGIVIESQETVDRDWGGNWYQCMK
jgi:hypothetical protein